MNEDILKGQWKQIRGQMKEWWDVLTDDDLDKINGQRDQLIGILQQKYGYDQAGADLEIINWLREVETKHHTKA